jgi:hypothetical protein
VEKQTLGEGVRIVGNGSYDGRYCVKNRVVFAQGEEEEEKN